MPVNDQSAMTGGGVLLAALLYAGASLYVTGPLVTHRTVERSGWLTTCQAEVRNTIRALHPPQIEAPELDCDMVFKVLGPEMRRLLYPMGMGAACQAIDAQKHQRAMAEKLKEQRLQALMARAGTRCRCAVSELIERRRLPLALYAGSARLIVPAPVKNLPDELTTSLHGPVCTAVAKRESGS